MVMLTLQGRDEVSAPHSVLNESTPVEHEHLDTEWPLPSERSKEERDNFGFVVISYNVFSKYI